VALQGVQFLHKYWTNILIDVRVNLGGVPLLPPAWVPGKMHHAWGGAVFR
jgi:hypothetical protein